MKSDREFIDGIYEKAKQYTTEENDASLATYERGKSKRIVWQTLSCAAALLLFCVAIDLLGGKTGIFQNVRQNEPIVQTEEQGVVFARYVPEELPSVTVTGVVSQTVPEQGYFLLSVTEWHTEDNQIEKPEMIQVLYEQSMYEPEFFVSGMELLVALVAGDSYGILESEEIDSIYPIYTLR